MAQRISVTLTFEDGSTNVVPIRPIGLLAAERKFGGEPPAIEGTLFAAWYGLKATNSDLPDFDAWVATLEGIAETVDADDANPTQAVAAGN